MYALESNLKRTASVCVCFLRTIIDIHYITLFLRTLKLDSKLHRVRDGAFFFLSKRHENGEKSSSSFTILIVFLSLLSIVHNVFIITGIATSVKFLIILLYDLLSKR